MKHRLHTFNAVVMAQLPF